MTVPSWLSRTLWVLGTTGRTAVFIGLGAGVFFWWDHGPGAADDSSTGAIAPALLILLLFGGLAGAWTVSEGLADVSWRLMLWRWVVVTVVVAVAGEVQMITDDLPVGAVEYLELMVEWLGELLVLGPFIVGGAAAGWTLGWISRRPDRHPSLVNNSPDRPQRGQ